MKAAHRKARMPVWVRSESGGRSVVHDRCALPTDTVLCAWDGKRPRHTTSGVLLCGACEEPLIDG